MGKVTLIGAGPGDASLITVKGLEKLKCCDAVIYDRLASEELLGVVREDCVLVYVGKKPGAHSMRQEEINRVLVEYAQKYENVVRLKGGDPFVFGRGGEEIMALRQAGIAYEVIPGITSAIAVPELAGIPVTHRGIARSFHVITGHTGEVSTADPAGHGYGTESSTADPAGMNDALAEDYETLAKLSGTLVFLMGLSNLEKITAELLRYGKPPQTPAAVIAEGTTPYERIVRGTLSDIAPRVRAAGLSSPVIIVIGETAAFEWKGSPDGGARENGVRRYGVTATPRTLAAFRDRMQEAGRRVVPLVTMQTTRLEAYDMLKEQLRRLCDYDWIFFTSRHAVELFFEAARETATDVRALAGCSFAVIGSGTEETLEKYGIYADFIPSHADTETFAAEFVQKYLKTAGEKENCPERKNAGIKPLRVLFAHAVQANPATAEQLRAAGADVTELSVYDVEGKRCGDLTRLAEITDLAFFSASGVRAFFGELRAGGYSLPPNMQFWCIGDPTKEALVQELSRRNQTGEGGEKDVAEEALVQELSRRNQTGDGGEKDVAEEALVQELSRRNQTGEGCRIHVAEEASADGLAGLILREENKTGGI